MDDLKGVTVVIGAQWGDEGKGKMVDILASKMDIVARCQGGNNAGHTIVADGVKYSVHLLPSGIISKNCKAVIGNGVVVNLPSLFDELKALEEKGIDWTDRLLVSDRAHLVLRYHQMADKLKEMERGKGSIGTTQKGIGPTYSSKANRTGLRVHHLLHFEEFKQIYQVNLKNKIKRFGEFECEAQKELEILEELVPKLRPLIVDTVYYMNHAWKEGKRILVEGANALMLDLDFGTYPYVTSSSCSIGGVCTGLGLPPKAINNVIGVVKAYTTRVGDGPFPTEQLNEIGEKLQDIGHEYGTTTGRRRRCGWLDAVVLQYSHMINEYTAMNLTKLDVFDTFEEIKIGVAYKHKGEILKSFPADLSLLAEVEVVYETLRGWKQDISKVRKFEDFPENCKKYISRIEELVGCPVKWIGVGTGREDVVENR